MIERNISKNDIISALLNPIHTSDIIVDDKGRKSVKYIGKEVTVVINPETGKRITSWPTSSRIRKKYQKEK